jgi:hypothetical protein
VEPNQNRKKLQLKKQAISNLTNADLEKVKAGTEEDAAITTSWGSCTGRHCCPTNTTTETITISIVISLITISL